MFGIRFVTISDHALYLIQHTEIEHEQASSVRIKTKSDDDTMFLTRRTDATYSDTTTYKLSSQILVA